MGRRQASEVMAAGPRSRSSERRFAVGPYFAKKIAKFRPFFEEKNCEISPLSQRNNERNLALSRRNKGQPQTAVGIPADWSGPAPLPPRRESRILAVTVPREGSYSRGGLSRSLNSWRSLDAGYPTIKPREHLIRSNRNAKCDRQDQATRA